MAAKSLAAFFVLLMAVANAHAAGPQLPCARADTKASHAARAMPARITIWRASELKTWQPPVCTGWPHALRAKLIVTLSGTFRFDGSMNDLVARAGKISQLPRITYWSTEDKKWVPLARRASALRGPNAKEQRDDFSAPEFKPGAQLYYWEDDSVTGDTIYNLKVRERTEARAVLGTDNVTPVRKFVFTLFEPGALRSVLILQRLAPGLYRASILSGAFDGTSSMADGHEEIYAARARAVYRYLATTKAASSRVALSIGSESKIDRQANIGR